MNFLFLHQNFPGQYRHLARYLVDQGHQVHFITQPNENQMAGVHKITYQADRRTAVNCHPYAVEFDRAMVAASGVADACRKLRDEGVRPDIVIGHCGWGETLFVKEVFPEVPLLANFEFYYQPEGADLNFDPEYTSVFTNPSRLRMRNAVNLLAFEYCDHGHSATRWQHSLFPEYMRQGITVIHEGVDTDKARPHATASFRAPGMRRALTADDEVLTYVARNLEPYRGFHVFMRALPELLRRRPKLHVLVVGGDGVSYGQPAPPGSTFRQGMLEELGDSIDLRRVHFLGQIEYASYLKVLQVSSAHVYLTYPFVLSWSFIEAMAAACLVIGSDTPPVREVLQDGVNGLLVDFFSREGLVEAVERALDRREEMRPLRVAARATAVEHFDLKRVLLPRWMELIDDLVQGRLARPR